MEEIVGKKGQSLLELATLGAILVSILGIVISYGLRYNYQQKAMMQAFRKAYNVGEDGSYTLVVDKHIPNPSDAFGVGSVSAVSGSGSVTRNYHMQDSAILESELPSTTIEIRGTNGSQTYSFTTAGFRDVANVTEDQIDKYEEIYGASSVCSDPDQGCGATEGACLTYEINPETNVEECSEYSTSIRILDPCEGEFVSADSIRRICFLIGDQTACANDCVRGGKSSSDCSDICSASIETPWYCGAEDSLFPSEKFPLSRARSMGIGVDTIQDTNINNNLSKHGLSATDSINWTTNTHRKIFYQSGHGLSEIDVDTGVSQNENWTW